MRTTSQAVSRTAGPRGRVLELACGTGILTKRLRGRLPLSIPIVATDLNWPMLEYARTKCGTQGIEWQEADMVSLPFSPDHSTIVSMPVWFMFAPD
jgi:ubiquinone/menaquinone biosynthesis C-methylase UbiE